MKSSYKRITADDALRHSYVARFHNVSEEIALNYDVVPPLSDDTQLTVDEYRSKLYEVNKNKTPLSINICKKLFILNEMKK